MSFVTFLDSGKIRVYLQLGPSNVKYEEYMSYSPWNTRGGTQKDMQ